MRIKITSDGTPLNTTVTNAETGEKLEGVRSIEFRLAVGEANKARLEVDLAKIDSATLDAVVGTVRDTVHSISYEFDGEGALKAIVLPAGSSVAVVSTAADVAKIGKDKTVIDFNRKSITVSM